MSTAHAHGTDFDTLARANGDPTRSVTLRRRYAQRLRGQFIKLRAAIRRGVADENVLRLGMETLQPRDPTDPPPFRFPSDAAKVDAFMRWLRRQEERGILEVIDRGDNQFVRSAYAKGVTQADAALNAQGVTVAEQELAAVFNTPVHRDALQQLFTRNFEELEGITSAMNQQISRELTDGFARGLGPDEMARNLTDRVNAIGRHRATLLARTETIRAHSTATLNRYEQFGTEQVRIQAEWLTAGDQRVCPICATLEGEVFTIQEARTETFRFEAGENDAPSLTGDYPVQPPAHVQCRCRLIPEVS